MVNYLGKVPQCRTRASPAAEATRAAEGTRPPAATARSAGTGAEVLLMPRSAPEAESGLGSGPEVESAWGTGTV